VNSSNSPIDICAIILVVVDVLCRDANKSGIAMTNSKLAVRTPNSKPCKHGDMDKQHCGNVNSDLDL
jgi:hypothetical protein